MYRTNMSGNSSECLTLSQIFLSRVSKSELIYISAKYDHTVNIIVDSRLETINRKLQAMKSTSFRLIT